MKKGMCGRGVFAPLIGEPAAARCSFDRSVGGVSWGSTYVRAATWAHFRLHETNREFCHINVHLDSISEEARLQGCLLILAQLASLHLDHLPLLLTGDFNVPTEVDPLILSIDPSVTNACYRLFLDQGFVDTYHAASKHEAKTE